MSFRLMNQRNHSVVFECDSVREIRMDEHIHYVIDTSEPDCIVCGCLARVWTDDVELWQRSAMRCL